MRSRCAHCGEPSWNSVGSLCEQCWRTAPNRYNSTPHKRPCPCWLATRKEQLIEQCT